MKNLLEEITKAKAALVELGGEVIVLLPAFIDAVLAGTKTQILKATKFEVAGKRFALSDGGRVLGGVELGEPVSVLVANLDATYAKHRVARPVRDILWPDATELFTYAVVKSWKIGEAPVEGWEAFAANLRGVRTELALASEELEADSLEADSLLGKSVWARAYVNDLADSSFLYIESGGFKDGSGRTVPRSLRHFPVRNANGDLDLPHVRNAIARIPQSNAPGLTDAKKTALQEKARRMLTSLHKRSGEDLAPRPTRLFKRESPVPEEHYVLGIVLEPEVEDLQGDIYSAEEVRKAAHHFMENHARLGLMHQKTLDTEAKILESFLAPVDFDVNGQPIRKGTWLFGARIVSNELWEKVKSGEFTGWSIGGFGSPVPDETSA